MRRAWDGNEWQEYAVKLIQKRHQSQNFQRVPDTVKGDAGLEGFSLDGCAYQCYAPQEVSDVAKAASAMKQKARADLQKLEKNAESIAKLLQGTKIKRWILACPFLDDKDVVADARAYGDKIKQKGLPFLADDFEVLIQCQEDFVEEIDHFNKLSQGPSLKFVEPSALEVQSFSDNPLTARLDEKLGRAFPFANKSEIARRKAALIKAYAFRENALSEMKSHHPDQWELAVQCLDAEENRLTSFGQSFELPNEQLNDSTAKIEKSLKDDLPGLPNSSRTKIATGTVSDWLIRCPLDFHGPEDTADGI